MNIIKDFITIGCKNRPCVKLKSKKGLVIHWIGVAQSKAKVIRNNFSNSKKAGATQYIIDYNTGDIIQTMPEDEMTYHVGAILYTRLKQALFGKENPNKFLVGIECCINDLDKIYNDYSSKKKYLDLGKPSEIQYENLIDFSADFLVRNNLTIDNLYRHYDITGKACHVYFYKHEDEWLKFKNDVKERMEEISMPRYANINEIPEWGQATVNKLIKKGYIAGTGNSLDLSLDMLRVFVINDKAGLYGKEEENYAKEMAK